jgi:rhamnulose-1-phosphate aldolase
MRKALDDMANVAMVLDEKGWSEGNAGNISVNVTETIGTSPDESLSSSRIYPLPGTFKDLAREYLLISGAGTRMRNLAKQPLMNLLLIKISDDGASFAHLPIRQEINLNLRPTSEFYAHLAIHEFLMSHHRTEKTIIHTHVNELIALTLDPKIRDTGALNKALHEVLPEMAVLIPGGAGLTPYLQPGSKEIASATVELFEHHDLILWSRHGVIAIGADPVECLDRIEIVSKAAKIYFLVRSSRNF